MRPADPASRCLRCRRPAALCLCTGLVPCATRTRVVILQHPRENGARMNTARLAHLGLAGSELHVGVSFDNHPRVATLARTPGGAALLYPGPDATHVDAVREPPGTLVVVDGTWHTARKLVARNRVLRGLPRLAVQLAQPSAYRIRREPSPECLSTLEAIVAALAALEGDAARFDPLRAAFARLVDTQLAHAEHAPAPYRHERRRRRARRPSPVETLLAVRFADVVVAQAEGHARGDGGLHELVHLLALRPATGARFDAVVRPRRPLAPHTPGRLGLTESELADGAAADDVRRAWAAFLRPGDVLVGWGLFTPAALAADSFACPPWHDLRSEVARRLRGRPGGTEAACDALGAPGTAAWAPGRGGRRLAALAALVSALRNDRS